MICRITTRISRKTDMQVLVLLTFVLSCDGFLLDSSTSSAHASLDDKRYNTLMNLLMEERRSRTLLETAVSRELLALKQEVAKCHCTSMNNNGVTNHVSTGILQMNDSRSLASELANLRKDHDLLKTKFQDLAKNNTDMNNKFHQLEFDMSSIQQLPNFTSARYLEEEIRTTRNRLNSVANDVNARKQDFIALYHKVIATEQQFENVTKYVNIRENQTILKVQQSMTTSLRQFESNLTSKLEMVVTSQNNMSVSLQSQLKTVRQGMIRNPVALTTCKKDKSVQNIVQFTDIQTSNGINDTDSIRIFGIFTCEKYGLYVISVYIQTNTLHSRFDIKRNNVSIAAGYTSITDYHQTTSVTVVSYLSPRDTISVAGSFFVNPGYLSCLTIFEI